MEETEREKAPGEILRNRYIPLDDVEEKLGVRKSKVQSLIACKKIRYAEFARPGTSRRIPHVDPVEICRVLKIKNPLR